LSATETATCTDASRASFSEADIGRHFAIARGSAIQKSVHVAVAVADNVNGGDNADDNDNDNDNEDDARGRGALLKGPEAAQVRA
jgi:hypothetical protein